MFYSLIDFKQSLLSATSLHNCAAGGLSHFDTPLQNNPASNNSGIRLIDTSERSHSVDEFRQPLSETDKSQQAQTVKEENIVQFNNNGVTTGTGSSGVTTSTASAGTGVRSAEKRRRRIKRRRPFCLRATLANFSTFCRQTSLHGWQYIAQKNTSTAKHMFWAIVVSMSMATAALFLYNNTMDYLNATVSWTHVSIFITTSPDRLYTGAWVGSASNNMAIRPIIYKPQ